MDLTFATTEETAREAHSLGTSMSHTVEAIALVLNHLVILGRAKGSEQLTEIVIEGLSSPTTAPVQGYCGFEIAEAWQGGPGDKESFGFIFACPLDFDIAREIAVYPGGLGLELRAGVDLVGETSKAIGSLLDILETGHEAVDLLCGEMVGNNPTFSRIVASIEKGDYLSSRIIPHLEWHVVAPGVGFVATGWTENLGDQPVVFLLDEFRLVIHPEQVFVNVRPEVLREIAGRSGKTGITLHAFTVIDAIGGSRHQLRLALLGGNEVQWSSTLELTELGNPGSLLQGVAAGVPPLDIQRRNASASVLRRFLASATGQEASFDSITYKTAGRVPDLSIIIPFYRDDFFLVDHLESQRRTDTNAEWIFVSDDPSLNVSMTKACQARRGSLPKATKLLCLSTNLGFARANNLAFRNASADFVLFMNSDVYWRSLLPITYGLDILRGDATVGIVGFLLHFEDETIQHAGMRFESLPELEDLVLLTHDAKGLPAKRYGSLITSREVGAVTGALMLVRRTDFEETVFDEGYVGGDFEDGDLCLQMRARGKRIVLVECDGLYHFERQSIGSGGVHNLFTSVNSVRFATKWKSHAGLLAPFVNP